MFDFVTHLVSGSAISYLVVFAVVVADGFFPVMPSEAVVVTAAILSASGHLSLPLVVAAGLLGAFTGDNISYLLGDKFGGTFERRFFKGDKARSRLRFARRMVKRRGGIFIVVARFLPGGRTAATFASGALDMRWRRFAVADAIAVTVWVGYVSALGYFGGSAFRNSLWQPMLLAAGVAALVALAGEVWRRVGSGHAEPQR